MPKRWCQCKGCPSCRTATGASGQLPAGATGTHGQLYDLDATGTLKCPGCQQQATTRRNARPSSSTRGLGWDFSKRKAGDRNYQEATRCQCTVCPQHRGQCGELFTADNPKTGGHVIPRSQGGGDGPILPICRQCNSADGGRMAHKT